jgi:hypothetical protein
LKAISREKGDVEGASAPAGLENAKGTMMGRPAHVEGTQITTKELST